MILIAFYYICLLLTSKEEKKRLYDHYVMSSLKQVSILKHVFYGYEAILAQTFVILCHLVQREIEQVDMC